MLWLAGEPSAERSSNLKGTDGFTELRGWFALAALFVFLITLGCGFALTGTKRWIDAKEVLSLVLPIEAGLLFAAGRYYFSRQSQRPPKRNASRKR
jgi:hypothetical protein